MKVAYIVSRFPKITETFVLNEMVAVEKQGVQISLYPLQRERTEKMHPSAPAWVQRARFTPWFNGAILRSNLHYLFGKPGVYLKALRDALWGARKSRRFLAGALAFFPKTAHIARMMEQEGITHVHAHFASHPTMAALIIHRLTGLPYSFTAHGSDIHRDKVMLAEKTAEAAFVVPISYFNRDVILQASAGQHAEKMRVIRCGVDLSRFTPNGWRTAIQPMRILCVGTLHEVKGQQVLIEACSLLKQRAARSIRPVPFTCHFVGDGPDMAMLTQKVAEAGLNEQVFFHGRLDQSEVVEQLHRADVLVTPSVPSADGRREGLPVVIVEAMACGLPVISSRLSGIPEIVLDGVNGFLTEPGDAAAIARAVETLANDPDLRRRFGEAGRCKVEAEFDEDMSAKQLKDLFAGGWKS